jgi:hypothetical protein
MRWLPAKSITCRISLLNDSIWHSVGTGTFRPYSYGHISSSAKIWDRVDCQSLSCFHKLVAYKEDLFTIAPAIQLNLPRHSDLLFCAAHRASIQCRNSVQWGTTKSSVSKILPQLSIDHRQPQASESHQETTVLPSSASIPICTINPPERQLRQALCC